MTMKKKRIQARSLSNIKDKHNKPSTATRAAITAEIKPTRGKQLVEHNPFSLIPDPQNPRPGDVIDDTWLKKHLKVGDVDSLCHINNETGEYIIPASGELQGIHSKDVIESYDFLRSLAYSIRAEGLIEPIEIFLADRNNDPEYFSNSDLDYGYVVLEGHQRRLAAMMASVATVTCIEITDETMLAKLKVKHRKLRRQLSENNLRKGLKVSQNYLIVKELLSQNEAADISARELSSIIGLNEDIAAALKRVISTPSNYPDKVYEMILADEVTYSWIRKIVSKTKSEIDEILANPLVNVGQKKEVKSRGRKGGALKRSVTFRINKLDEVKQFQQFLLERFPELDTEKYSEFSFKSMEELLDNLKKIALNS